VYYTFGVSTVEMCFVAKVCVQCSLMRMIFTPIHSCIWNVDF